MHKLALVLAIAAVGEGLIGLHLVRQLHAERASAQALQARVAELERSSTQRPGATFVAVPTQQTVSPFSGVGQGAPPQPAGSSAGNSTLSLNAVLPRSATPAEREQMREQIVASVERERTLLRDPEYREAMQLQQKMALMRSNPDVAKDLDLTADQVDRLFETLADQALRQMESANVLWDQPPDPAKLQELQRKAMEQQGANEAELKSVLGEAKYRDWQEYQAMTGVRWEAARLRTSLASAGVPLDETLAKPLMKVLQEQNKVEMQRLERYASTANAQQGFIVSGNNALQAVTNSVESLAQSQRQQREALARVLTAEQIKVIEEEHNADLQMQRVQLRLVRAQREAGVFDQVQSSDGSFVGQTVTVAPASD